MTHTPTLDELAAGVEAADRAMLGRAITLVESRRADHRQLAMQLLQRLLPHDGKAWRVGITGVPGVGKSTFIDTLGTRLTAQGRRVAVLTIDPTSQVSGGSILGDKTRMHRLSINPHAFVRPSPTAGTLGGVARATRESMLVCEAAGFDVVLVETVGVGQSETVVDDMVDTFLVLLLAGAGDELQGIKRGLMELADVLVVNKADGANQRPALLAAREMERALRYLVPPDAPWMPPVLTCSALEERGIDDVWAAVAAHRDALTATGELAARRQRQLIRWMWRIVEDRLITSLREHPGVQGQLADVVQQVRDHVITPAVAAERLLRAFGGDHQ